MQIVWFSLALLYLVNGAPHGEGSRKGKEVATLNSDHERCQFGFLLNELDAEEKVYHAHWPGEKIKCVALKIYNTEGISNKELEVLKYFNRIDESNFIIKMLGSGKTQVTLMDFIVLELGGKDLKNYFHERIIEVKGNIAPRANEEILIKIIRGAAQALEQFHKYGAHGDIKYENFVVSLENDPSAEIIDVKLIDFHTSLIYVMHDRHDVEKSRKNDIVQFGKMVSKLFNEYYPPSDGNKSVKELLIDSNYDHNSKLGYIINFLLFSTKERIQKQ